MQTQRWKATWIDQDGTTQACAFVSRANRVIAEMDFQAIRAYQNRPLPEGFTLEENQRVFQMLPSLKGLEEQQ